MKKPAQNLYAVILFLALTVFSNLNSFAMDIGDQLPELDVTNHNGDLAPLKSYDEAEFLFVFFYPKADTPGCTAQACSLRDAYESLLDANARVLGVSGDKVAAQGRFKEKRELPYPLISDGDGKVMKAFDVPSFLGISKRQAFLFRNGELVWKDESASTKSQAQDALAAIADFGAQSPE